jgi:hypothetical protein
VKAARSLLWRQFNEIVPPKNINRKKNLDHTFAFAPRRALADVSQGILSTKGLVRHAKRRWR